MSNGWLIGVMIELAGEPAPVRHFFAVAHDDRNKAEWTAIDRAMLIGGVAVSPVKGLEPVHVIGPLAPRTVKSLALKPGEVRPLGWKWPRRWLALAE